MRALKAKLVVFNFTFVLLYFLKIGQALILNRTSVR
jgi:hypothetical protein